MRFHCSSCGVELTHYRKAVPGKGHIFDLIDPHECEGYAIKADEEDRPTVLDILKALKDLGKLTKQTEEESSKLPAGPGDRRDDKSKITSTAPDNLFSNIRNLDPAGPNV